MDMKYINPMTTIIAVVIGFVLAEGASWLRARSESKGAANTTRSLVEMEIESNKRLLFEYWRTIIASTDKWYSQEGQFNYVKLGPGNCQNTLPFSEQASIYGPYTKTPIYL